jgi:hypothetical protein
MEEKRKPNTILLESELTPLGTLELYTHLEEEAYIVLLDREEYFVPLWLDRSEDAACFYFDLFLAAAEIGAVKKLTNLLNGDIIEL